MTGYDKVSSMCNKFNNYYSSDEDDDKYKTSKKCNEERDKKLEKVEFKCKISLTLNI